MTSNQWCKPWRCGFGHTAFDNRANYSGPDFSEYLTVPWTTHRDADALQRTNFAAALAKLQAASTYPDDPPSALRQGSWAVGWIKCILIHPADAGAIARAEELGDAYEDYPVLDEEEFSRVEWDEASDCWESMSIRERAALRAKVPAYARGSLFSIRRSLGDGNDLAGHILDALRTP